MSDSRQLAFEALSKSVLFKNLPDAAIMEAVGFSRAVTLRKGQKLFGRGDTGLSMFVILKGSIEISLTSSDGRKISLNMMEPGTCLGEMGVLDGLPRSADAMAMSASTLIAIPRDGFIATARKYPDLALALARMLSGRIRWISDSVEDFALLPIDRRLARRVLILFERFSDTNGVIALSQGDLADFVGATRETTNRILAAWRRRGWISMGRRKITLLDRDSLDAFAMTAERD